MRLAVRGLIGHALREENARGAKDLSKSRQIKLD
jgi:hypothetical protein